jgi:hypothetical protein
MAHGSSILILIPYQNNDFASQPNDFPPRYTYEYERPPPLLQYQKMNRMSETSNVNKELTFPIPQVYKDDADL